MASRERITAEKRNSTKRRSEDLDMLEEFQQGLQIDKHALDEAWEEHPDLYYRVSERVAILTSQRDAAKQELAIAEAEADARVRRKAAKDEEKTTEAEIKARIRLDQNVEDAQKLFAELSLMAGKFAAMKDSYIQRSYALKGLVELHVSNYYETTSNTRSGNKIKDESAQVARRVMAQARRERE